MKTAKKMVFLALICLIMAGTFSACRRTESAAGSDGPFPGKIAIVTNTVSQNEEEFRSAENFVAKYGANKIVHVTWPDNFMAEQEQMVTTVARLAADMDIKALVINQAVPGTNAAVDRLLQSRDDIFIVFCQPQENPPDIARRANLVLNTDDFARGPAIARQAQAQGAQTFIHYSFPRHLGVVTIAARRDEIRDYCQRMGIQYIDVTAPDPTGDGGITATQQFILEDVPRQIRQYGANTTFFGTNCAMQVPMLTRIVEGKAIYTEPCCPSPTHAFPQAFGIDAAGRGADIPFMIEEITKAVAAQGMHGRLSTWPAPASMVWTGAGVEYAIKVLNGEVPSNIINESVLKQVVTDHIFDYVGTQVAIDLRSFPDPSLGRNIDNYKLVIMGHLAF